MQKLMEELYYIISIIPSLNVRETENTHVPISA